MHIAYYWTNAKTIIIVCKDLLFHILCKAFRFDRAFNLFLWSIFHFSSCDSSSHRWSCIHGRSDGGYIGIYTPQISPKFCMWLFCLLDPGQFSFKKPCSHESIFKLSAQLILREISKIGATRYQILRLDCTKFDFGWGSAGPRSRWGSLQRSPRPPSCI